VILITGGTGFIGLHTARALIETGHDVVLTRYRVARELSLLGAELGRRAVVERLDVTDADELADLGRRYAISGLLHLAVPARDALSPSDELRANTSALANVLDASVRWELPRVAIASSVAVYGGIGETRLREDARLTMSSRTATEAFKKALEILADQYADRTGLGLVNLRITTIWGPLYHSMWNFPSRAVHAAVQGVELVDEGRPVYADDGGDLCYVRDCATALALVLTAPELRHRTYNIGAGRATTNAEFAAAVRRVVPGARLALRAGSAPDGPGVASAADIERLRDDTGFQPAYGLDAAVADYVDWLRAGNAR
jgi:UDP-glucose 4-epimerase